MSENAHIMHCAMGAIKKWQYNVRTRATESNNLHFVFSMDRTRNTNTLSTSQHTKLNAKHTMACTPAILVTLCEREHACVCVFVCGNCVVQRSPSSRGQWCRALCNKTRRRRTLLIDCGDREIARLGTQHTKKQHTHNR